MDLPLEQVKRDLAHHRVDHVLDLRREHRPALGRVRRRREKLAEGQHLAEHAGRLGEGSMVSAPSARRSARREPDAPRARVRGQGSSHPAAYPGSSPARRGGRRARSDARRRPEPSRDGSAHRSSFGRRTAGQSLPCRVRTPRRRSAPCPAPRSRGWCADPPWATGVAVPIGEGVLPEPLRFQLVVAVRQARIGSLHGIDQGRDHLRLDPVRQVAGIGDIAEAAPAIRDLLVLGERVGDQREDPQVRPQDSLTAPAASLRIAPSGPEACSGSAPATGVRPAR